MNEHAAARWLREQFAVMARCIGVALLLAFLGSAGNAQEMRSEVVDPITHCKLFLWPPLNREARVVSVRWGGRCLQGEADGRGVVEFVEKYAENGVPLVAKWKGEGEFAYGGLEGRGFMVHDDERVEGEFRYGRLNGRGIVQTKDERLEGQFRDGWLDGVGFSEEYTAGKVLHRKEGEWRNGVLQGPAIERWRIAGCKAEAKYEGEFDRGRYHGRGTLKRADGRVLTGRWENGQLDNVDSRSMLFDISIRDEVLKACTASGR